MSATSPLLGGTLCLDFINTPGELTSFLGDGPIPPALLASARRLRTSLQRVLEAEARGIGAPEPELDVLNKVLTHAGERRGLRSTIRGYGWGWLDGSSASDQSLWPVAFSAARLLTGPDLVRLKTCDSCGRLFLDASRNRSRRWCDMQGCGNRAKVSRYRGRVRDAQDASSPMKTPLRLRG